jgi:hypothetical protein
MLGSTRDLRAALRSAREMKNCRHQGERGEKGGESAGQGMKRQQMEKKECHEGERGSREQGAGSRERSFKPRRTSFPCLPFYPPAKFHAFSLTFWRGGMAV